MIDEQRMKDSETDRIVQALETAPGVAAPNDFVARVMARVPQQPHRRYALRRSLGRRVQVGRSFAFAALLILIAGMLLLAPHTAGSQTWLLLQGLLFVQLVALLLWMGIFYKRLL